MLLFGGLRYRLLGRSGLRVSELFLGAMTFGEDFSWGADRQESARILDAYLHEGGNVVDRALDDAVSAGKVLHVGISDAPAWLVAQANTLADWRGWTPFAARDQAVADAVADVADQVGATSAQVALAWTMSRSRRVHPIVGARSAAQLLDNLGALRVVLAPKLLADLEAATQFQVGFP
ncbi:MAG: aldo/keto reductase [Pseudonocardiaceae bacterium]